MTSSNSGTQYVFQCLRVLAAAEVATETARVERQNAASAQHQ